MRAAAALPTVRRIPCCNATRTMNLLPSRFAGRRAHPSRGLTMVELLCCASIAATVLGSALPSLVDLGRRQRLQSAAAELQTDIHFARSAAVQRNQPIRLSWQALPDGGACYVVHSGDADQCSCGAAQQTVCRDGAEAIRTAVLPPGDAITLAAATRSVLFDGRRGTVTPTATFKLADAGGRAMHLVVNIMGRVRRCSPDGQLGGVKRC